MVGRAYRWSALAFVLIVFLVVGGIWLARRKPAPPPAKVTQITAPVAPAPSPVSIPEVQFVDITASSGIRFVHNNGAYGEKLLPETMGGGVAFLDYDGDGDQDLLLINSTYWPGHRPPGAQSTPPALYRNDGTGRFEDVTRGSGLDVDLYGMGVAVGDYDNDGRVDVFISAVGPNRLFHNEGNGTFRDVSTQAGVQGGAADWGSSCAWFDYDNDGDLDLFVANYVQWSREIDFEVNYRLDGIGRAYGPPMNFPGTFPFLYRNDGQGKFTDVTAASGLQRTNAHTGVAMAKSLGVAPVDLDRDGWMDLVVANDTVPNFVFHNQRNGAFAEIGAAAGLAFDNYGQTRGAMGIDTGHFHNDTRLGVVIGNFANEMTALYVAQPNPLLFTDDAIPEGVGPASRLLLKFGVFFFDCDLDGRLDLLSANGHLEQEIAKVQQSQTYAQPAQLFWNCGQARGPTYLPVTSAQAGPGPLPTHRGPRFRLRRYRRRRRSGRHPHPNRRTTAFAPQRSAPAPSLAQADLGWHPMQPRRHRRPHPRLGQRQNRPPPSHAGAQLPLAVGTASDHRFGRLGPSRPGGDHLARGRHPGPRSLARGQTACYTPAAVGLRPSLHPELRHRAAGVGRGRSQRRCS